MRVDVLIVGAGFAGCVCAEMFASAGQQVVIIDKRQHIGGNAFDVQDRHGVLVHQYGPHIFHTNSQKVFDYLSRFTKWRTYEHRVLAAVQGRLLPIPINRTTINELYGLDLNEEGVTEYLEKVRVKTEHLTTSEDVVLASVGKDLCEKFFRGYTRKQWGLDLSELSAGVAARVPTRTNDDDRYFSDKFQVMPANGYTEMFGAMLDHRNIEVQLDRDFEIMRERTNANLTVFTGPIDAYYKYQFGHLPYRCLRFEHTHIAKSPLIQPVGTINYPNDHAYTRTTEFRHLTGQDHSGTSLVREFPEAEGDPYYPVPRKENEILFKRYEALAEFEKNVVFVGRLAQYRYYNMDQVVAAAFTKVEQCLGGGSR